MSVKRSISEYWKGSKAYAALRQREKAGLRNFVSRTESNQRAEICIKCPFNDKSSGLVKLTDEIMSQQVGGRKTDHDHKLNNCDACSCPLKLSIHLHADFLRETKDSRELFERIRKQEKKRGKLIHPACWLIKIF